MKHKYLSIAIMPILLAVVGTAFLLHEKPYPTEPAATIESTPTESTPAPEAIETKPKPIRTEEFIVTAYAYTGSRTATGVWPEEGMCAADWNVLPPGSIVNIPGYGIAVVTDRGGAIKGHRLDVYFNSEQVARCWGKQTIDVEILEVPE